VNEEKDLFSIAERLRNIVSKTSFQEVGKDEIKVTISIGGTMMGPLSHDKLLIQKADQGLYQSKHNGRNKTTIV
jgi:diguanylate cyclase (GGDEF)-like protein